MAHGLLSRWLPMIKLTRLHNQVLVVNPDHIYEAEASPDTTLRLVNGETIIVKETLDELISKVVAYRQRICGGHDALAVAAVTVRHRDDEDTDGGVR